MLCGTNRIIYNSFVQKVIVLDVPSYRCCMQNHWSRGEGFGWGGGGGGKEVNTLGNLVLVLPLIFL